MQARLANLARYTRYYDELRSAFRAIRRVKRTVLPGHHDRIVAQVLKVHGWTSEERLRYLMDHVQRLPDGSRVVEVGVWQGRSAIAMAEACRRTRKRVYAIDPWADYTQCDDSDPNRYRQGTPRLAEWGVSSMEEVYQRFVENRRRLGIEPWLQVIRAPSVDAAKRWDQGPVSMLFLDGNHDYEFVRADLEAWVPLVVAGGLIIGDDWAWIGVRRAAVEFMADAWIRNPGAHLELYDDLWATRKV